MNAATMQTIHAAEPLTIELLGEDDLFSTQGGSISLGALLIAGGVAAGVGAVAGVAVYLVVRAVG